MCRHIYYVLKSESQSCIFSDVFQVVTASSSMPLKVSAALSAAEKAGCALTELMQSGKDVSNLLKQVSEI